MSNMEIGRLVDQWVKLMNAREYDKATALYASDVVDYEAPIEKTTIGVDRLQKRLFGILRASEDIHLQHSNVFVAQNKAVVELTMSGTNTGPFLGYKPTGRHYRFTTCLMIEAEDGKIVKHTSYLDRATILSAMGMIEIPDQFDEAA